MARVWPYGPPGQMGSHQTMIPHPYYPHIYFSSNVAAAGVPHQAQYLPPQHYHQSSSFANHSHGQFNPYQQVPPGQLNYPFQAYSQPPPQYTQPPTQIYPHYAGPHHQPYQHPVYGHNGGGLPAYSQPPAQFHPHHAQPAQPAHQPYQYPAYGHNGRGLPPFPGQHQGYPYVASRFATPEITWYFPANASPATKDYLLFRWNQSKIFGQQTWKGVHLETVGFRILQEQVRQQSLRPSGIVAHRATAPQHTPSIPDLLENSGIENLDVMPSLVKEDIHISRAGSSRNSTPGVAQDRNNLPVIKAEPKDEQAVHLRIIVRKNIEVPFKKEDGLAEVKSPLQAESLASQDLKIKEEDFENRTRTRLRSGTQALQDYTDYFTGGGKKLNGRKRKAESADDRRKRARGHVRVKNEPDH